MKTTFRLIALIVMCTFFVFAMASCAGQFSLTHGLLSWNNSLNKVLASFILFLFIIIPVYGFTLLIDWAILNVIEFYSGSNPIRSTAANESTTIDGTDVSLNFIPGDGLNFDLRTAKDGQVRELIVRTEGKGLVATLNDNGESKQITAFWNDEGGVTRCEENECEDYTEAEVERTVASHVPLGTMIGFAEAVTGPAVP